MWRKNDTVVFKCTNKIIVTTVVLLVTQMKHNHYERVTEHENKPSFPKGYKTL